MTFQIKKGFSYDGSAMDINDCDLDHADSNGDKPCVYY